MPDVSMRGFQCGCFMRELARKVAATLRLMVGVGDYDAYVNTAANITRMRQCCHAQTVPRPCRCALRRQERRAPLPVLKVAAQDLTLTSLFV